MSEYWLVQWPVATHASLCPVSTAGSCLPETRMWNCERVWSVTRSRSSLGPPVVMCLCLPWSLVNGDQQSIQSGSMQSCTSQAIKMLNRFFLWMVKGMISRFIILIFWTELLPPAGHSFPVQVINWISIFREYFNMHAWRLFSLSHRNFVCIRNVEKWQLLEQQSNWHSEWDWGSWWWTWSSQGCTVLLTYAWLTVSLRWKQRRIFVCTRYWDYIFVFPVSGC